MRAEPVVRPRVPTGASTEIKLTTKSGGGRVLSMKRNALQPELALVTRTFARRVLEAKKETKKVHGSRTNWDRVTSRETGFQCRLECDHSVWLAGKRKVPETVDCADCAAPLPCEAGLCGDARWVICRRFLAIAQRQMLPVRELAGACQETAVMRILPVITSLLKEEYVGLLELTYKAWRECDRQPYEQADAAKERCAKSLTAYIEATKEYE